MIFGADKYEQAVSVIPPVAASTFFIFLYSIIGVLQFYYEKTQFMMIASGVAAGLNLLLNYIFVPLYGYAAAGYTTLICYILYCIGHHFMSKMIAKKYNNSENIYDFKGVLIISIFVITMCILSSFMTSMLILRYIYY